MEGIPASMYIVKPYLKMYTLNIQPDRPGRLEK